MARLLLWVFVIIGFVVEVIDSFQGTHMSSYTKIVILGSISILALCEAIEGAKK